MTVWSTKLEELARSEFDKPHRLKPDRDKADSGHLDAFVVVTKTALEGSVPFPDVPGKFLTGFSNICTHMGCRLAREGIALPRDKSGALVSGPCPCHGTTFNLSHGGVVVLGPASQHLPQLKLYLRDDQTTVMGSFPTGNAPPGKEQWPKRSQDQD
jgi:Rieske Fe-S protein